MSYFMPFEMLEQPTHGYRFQIITKYVIHAMTSEWYDFMSAVHTIAHTTNVNATSQNCLSFGPKT